MRPKLSPFMSVFFLEKNRIVGLESKINFSDLKLKSNFEKLAHSPVFNYKFILKYLSLLHTKVSRNMPLLCIACSHYSKQTT